MKNISYLTVCFSLLFAGCAETADTIIADAIPPDAADAPLFMELEGHTKIASTIAFSPDGKKVVTASDDRTARIWDAESGKELHKLVGHTSSVDSTAFSPDGKKIVTASGDQTARIWDAESGKMLQNLEGHTGWVSSVAFSPDGKKIVTSSHDQTARIWDAESGKMLQMLSAGKDSGHVGPVTFSSDGKKVVAAGDTARIWNLAAVERYEKERIIFFDTLHASAEKGDAEAQFLLGSHYFSGEHITENKTEAIKWYRKAADQGHADAQVHLAAGYIMGAGVAQNMAEGQRWLRKAAEQGHEQAALLLKGLAEKANTQQQQAAALAALLAAAQQQAGANRPRAGENANAYQGIADAQRQADWAALGGGVGNISPYAQQPRSAPNSVPTPSQPAASKVCQMCNGRGHTGQACTTCRGTGMTQGFMGQACRTCNGTKFTPCPLCTKRGT